MTSDYSSPPYTVRVVKDVHVPMSDGTFLAADLFLPDASGRFPVVFDYYPYRKDDTTASRLREHRYFARHGYVAIALDVRGTGNSGGVAVDEYVLQEQLDAVDAIEWMSKQPWSNGNVGMFGISYGGFNSVQVAMHRPPALKAICPMYFTDNRYTDDCHYKGGALQMLYDIGTYGLSMVVRNAMPPYPRGTGAEWARIWEEHLESEPWILRWLENQTLNDYWRHGSLCEDYGAIECAVYIFGGWRDGYTNCNLRTFQHLRCPKKALIGPWLHIVPELGVPGPRIDHIYEMIRFFDYWLKGIDNGVMDEPPITIYVQRYDPPRAERDITSGFWRHESDWPLDRVAARPLYLGESGALESEAPASRSVASYEYHPTAGTTFGMFSGGYPQILPVDQRLEDAYSSNWTSEPLRGAVEILGRPEALLTVAATAEIATIAVRLIDVAPDGTAALVTKGALNLTHRDSHEDPSPLVPGRQYEIAVPLDATSWLFEPGHRIRLSIGGADFPNVWPSPRLYTGQIYFGGRHDSRLVLPVVGPQEPSPPPPRLRPPAPYEPTAEVQSDRPAWKVTRDYIAGTVEVYIRTGGRTRVGDEIDFTSSRDANALVHERNPARASIRGENQVALRWPNRTITTRARGQIESTETDFHVTIQLDVTMDGFPHFNKRWVRTIPRHLL